MNNSFTPGPWVAEQDPGDSELWGIHADPPGCGAVLVRIATVEPPAWNHVDGESLAANAHLIAAAPMLYEAMDRILNAETATQYGVDNDNRSARYKELAMALQDGRAALKAARGES